MSDKGRRRKSPREAETEQASRAQPRLVVRRLRLVVREGPDSGKSALSEGKPVVIGTHESADMVLHDRTVSRFHCEVLLQDGSPVIRDLGSRNGTWVNGVPVLHAPLLQDSLIAVGRTKLHLDIGKRVKVAASSRDHFGRLVGRSVSMRAVYEILEHAAASDSTVLLEGPTGTGKDLAAEAVHTESARRNGPFVVVDCGAIPPRLAASEIFGHERGAFTGAVDTRIGALEAANGGTLFLDEIGELDPQLQPQLLRAVERREVKRIGAAAYRPVDVRFIAATHRDLRSAVNTGGFRSDLFYRLAVLRVRLPALSEHLEDLPVLVDALLEDLGALDHAAAQALRAEGFLAHLGHHSWPGNVRELRNYLEQSLILESPEPLFARDGHLPPAVDTSQSLRTARERWVSAFERRYLEQLVAEHGGNIQAAARAAGVDRTHLYRMLWRHGLR